MVVKPIFTYEIPVRREKTSWRSWGGIQTESDAGEEMKRIRSELEALKSSADFPVEFLPLAGIKRREETESIADLKSADLILIYAAGGSMNIFSELNKSGRNIIFFCRHKSGPVYLWYEIISPRYLRQHTDHLSVNDIDMEDVVIDSQDELLWRMRALCGLKNTVNSTILAVGGPGAWSQPLETTMKRVQETFKLNIQDISYEELGKLIKEAKNDRSVIRDAKENADRYLQDKSLTLETNRQYVENCFVLEAVFRKLMDNFSCRAITINECMGTIMPLAETTACLTLSLLNDAGYLAFCESDFVVVPAGILMANISGKPSFLNDPTYPHDNIITLAHCTAPRKMNGSTTEPARILTHFESDYGAAPKVEMKKGQVVTNIMPDFGFKRNVGLKGEIIDNPFMDICRSQIDIKFECDSRKVADLMPGFHWITVYGDYLKEAGYALKKIGIELEIA
ncbi:MAG: sugar isomerase [Bacteroidales bacterium]|nr:sugar isomerase [Bacteroidales bacterium]